METVSISEHIFEGNDFSTQPLEFGEYEECIFAQCNFSGANLSGFTFTDCEFRGCDLSNVVVKNTSLQNIRFVDCKLLGVHFENCNHFLLSFMFEKCVLNLASFFKLKIKKTEFRNCIMHETDFTQSDLSSSLFDHCDLARTHFVQTNLEKADLRTSYNYSIDPEANRMKKAKFSATGVAGLLDNYDIIID